MQVQQRFGNGWSTALSECVTTAGPEEDKRMSIASAKAIARIGPQLYK